MVSDMARLKPKKRARLPDRAFAYIDSRGRRRLPIHDKAHVRNALARFNQVDFESDAAREQARKRLLNAAKKYRIVPVGFITRQLQSERKYATARIQATAMEAAALPTGFVTLLMSDIEGSTVLLRKLGDRYGALLNDVRGILRAAVSGSGGREIDARADEFFAVFERAGAAVEAAVAVPRDLAARGWTDGLEVRLRIGIHSGHPTRTEAGYIGRAGRPPSVTLAPNVSSSCPSRPLEAAGRLGLRHRELAFHPSLQFGEEDRDLLALAFQRALGGEDLLGEFYESGGLYLKAPW